MAERSAQDIEGTALHCRPLSPLSVGDHVLVQNQHGSHPTRWNNKGIIVEALQHRHYRVKLHGSNRVALRNRTFLRPYKPTNNGPTDVSPPSMMIPDISRFCQDHQVPDLPPQEITHRMTRSCQQSVHPQRLQQSTRHQLKP